MFFEIEWEFEYVGIYVVNCWIKFVKMVVG